MSSVRVFIASVGNPGPLYKTLHSAGHTLVDAMHSTLSYPPFHSNLSASSSAHALYKSPVLMNESGPAIYKAYRGWKASLPSHEQAHTRLLVVHDEMELKLGQLKYRRPGSSLKGHNGLKSVERSASGRAFHRLAIGIGRPLSRGTRDVTAHVLRRMTALEIEAIEGRVLDACDMVEVLARQEESLLLKEANGNGGRKGA